jgi:5-methylcytosine-specific restriction endonuclease McrA
MGRPKLAEKACGKCGVVKPRSEFGSKGGSHIKYWCKQCHNRHLDKRRAERMAEDPEYRQKVYAKKRRQRVRRWETKPSAKAVDLLRAEFGRLFRDRFGSERLRAKFGFPAEEVMAHLERQFLPGMTWANYGSYWHIDHIVPVSAFRLANEAGEIDWDEARRCWALTNLRPLSARANSKKGGTRLHLL